MYLNRTECSMQESSESVIEEILNEHRQKIHVYCYNILRNTHDAEDAVQEVCLKAFQGNKLLTIENKSAWMYKIAYNHCINKVKRRKLIKFVPFIENNDTKDIADDSDQHSDLELSYILSKLNPKERAMIVLRIIEDKDFTEIAEILEINTPTARKRFERIKSKVQKIIERRVNDEQRN